MSGKGKRKDEQDYASDGDSEGHAPPKKFTKKNSDDSDGIVVCEVPLHLCPLVLTLSNVRVLLWKIFWGLFVDIQEPEGVCEELARQGCGGYSGILHERWEANAWQERFLNLLIARYLF